MGDLGRTKWMVHVFSAFFPRKYITIITSHHLSYMTSIFLKIQMQSNVKYFNYHQGLYNLFTRLMDFQTF